MKLTAYSRNRILETLKHWDVPKDFAEPMYNYLVFGFSPGSCFTAVLANDFYRAVSSSHPANTIEAFKALAGWIQDTVPLEACGNYKAVYDWCNLKEDVRRDILEQHNLVYSEQDEIMLTLKGESTHEPMLY